MSDEKELNGLEMVDLSNFTTAEDTDNMAPLLDNVIALHLDNDVKDVTIDVEAFQKGMHSVSELCGAITALANVGINPHKAMDYLVDKEASKEIFAHNIEIAKIQSDSTISTLKSELANMQKNMI